MKVLSSEAMSLTDKRTMIDQNVDEVDLVKRASKACFEYVKKIVLDKDKNIVVVCGNSNNAADGFGLAFLLKENNYKNTKVLYVGNLEKMNKTCHHFYSEYIEKYNESLIFNLGVLNDCDYIIDAIVGNGLRGNLKEDVARIVEFINLSKAKKIALDLPSGLNANLGDGIPCIKADYTLAINNLKLGHLLNNGPDLCGKTYVVDIGLNDYDDLKHIDVINKKEFKDFFVRKANSNKYDYGNVLVIGSNKSMTGAGILSSYSALKSGAGLVTLACPEDNYQMACVKSPLEIMNKSLDDEDLLYKKDTVVFGPGLGRSEKYISLLEKLLSLDINLIVDADGLHLLSNIKNIKDKKCRLVITPHIGEAAALLNITSKEVREDIFLSFEKLIEKYDCIVVLKGHNILVGDKNHYFISLSGNSGMATAGSGDVLSGIIGGIIGKKLDLSRVCLGVYLHGLAGDIAKKEYGETSLVASDICNSIYKAIKEIGAD